jgi:hypothetical protein
MPEMIATGLHNSLAFAAIKNILDEGQRSGTIIIDKTNLMWNHDGFNKDLLTQQGALGTRTLGDHTMTTYIDHRTVHFGDEVPQKGPKRWKLTVYVLFVEKAILARFSRAYDKTLLHTPFAGYKIDTIKDEEECISYTLISTNRKQLRNEVAVWSSTNYREIRRRIARQEGMEEGFLQLQEEGGAIPELQLRLGDPDNRPLSPEDADNTHRRRRTTKIVALDTEGGTRRKSMAPRNDRAPKAQTNKTTKNDPHRLPTLQIKDHGVPRRHTRRNPIQSTRSNTNPPRPVLDTPQQQGHTRPQTTDL